MAVADKAFGAIHEGDRFTDKRGNVWEVLAVEPFGKLDMFCKARSLFTYMRHADVRANFTRCN